MFRCLDLLVVFLGEIAQRDDIRMAVKRIGVEAHLGVEANEPIVLGDDKGIDFQRLMSLPTNAAKSFASSASRALPIALELQSRATRRPCCGMVPVQNRRKSHDFFRLIIGDFIDIHSASASGQSERG